MKELDGAKAKCPGCRKLYGEAPRMRTPAEWCVRRRLSLRPSSRPPPSRRQAAAAASFYR
jgi:hypothetical protein